MEREITRYNHLNKEEKALLKLNGVSNQTFNQRVKRGWDVYDAIHLPSSFRMYDGELRKTLVTRENVHFVFPNHYYKMQAHGLTSADVINRINNGAAFNDAINLLNGDSEYDEVQNEEKIIELPQVQQSQDNKTSYAQLLFEQSCKQFLEAK